MCRQKGSRAAAVEKDVDKNDNRTGLEYIASKQDEHSTLGNG